MPKLIELFGLGSILALPPRFNIAPTQLVAVVREKADSPQRELVLMHWGLIPSCADDPKIGNRMINARAETISEKRSFKKPLQSRRCLILADGFYEWRKLGATKQPYLIQMKDGAPFAFAGLWESCSRVDPPIESCTIITTAANELMAPLHERMPVILAPEEYQTWVDPAIGELQRLLPLLDFYPSDEMQAFPVSTAVNRPSNDRPECVEPIAF